MILKLIVLDDGSHDDSVRVLEELKCAIPQLRVIEHDRPAAMAATCALASRLAPRKGLLQRTATRSSDAREIKLLVQALRPGVDVVNGWKIQAPGSLASHPRRPGIPVFCQGHVRLTIRDVDCDFRLMRRRIFDVVQLESVTGTITFEMVKKIQDAVVYLAEVSRASFLPPVRHIAVFQLCARDAHARRPGGFGWWRLVVKQEGKQRAQRRSQAGQVTE